MFKTANDKTIITNKDKADIFNFLSDKSPFLQEIVKDEYDDILLIHKIISHSDIPFMKRTNKGDSYSKNLLYYLTADETEKLKLDEIAHQTSINPSDEFSKFLSIPSPSQRRNNPTDINIAKDIAKIYLINDKNLKYFSKEYTELVIHKLNKVVSETQLKSLSFGSEQLIEIKELHLSAHGIGRASDTFFHDLRANIFKGDLLNILLTKKNREIKIYFLLEKNPRFYTLINETNEIWEQYLTKQLELNQLKINNNISQECEYEEKTRIFQNKWREMLADEAMIYTKTDKIICPISNIEATRGNFLTLFRASHIQSFASCNDNKEAYDINNGLLLSASIDALFDKFLISIDKNKKLKLSFLFEQESIKLLDDLRIQKDKEIPSYFLNDKRMEFMAWHYEQFLEKEEKRKSNGA